MFKFDFLLSLCRMHQLYRLWQQLARSHTQQTTTNDEQNWPIVVRSKYKWQRTNELIGTRTLSGSDSNAKHRGSHGKKHSIVHCGARSQETSRNDRKYGIEVKQMNVHRVIIVTEHRWIQQITARICRHTNETRNAETSYELLSSSQWRQTEPNRREIAPVTGEVDQFNVMWATATKAENRERESEYEEVKRTRKRRRKKKCIQVPRRYESERWYCVNTKKYSIRNRIRFIRATACYNSSPHSR